MFAELHSWIFESLVQPLLYHWDLMGWAELAYDGTELFLIGVLEILALWAILTPLERFWPIERWNDRRPVRVDIFYTLINRLGLLPVFFFLALQPAFDWINANLRMNDLIPPNLEDGWPWLAEHPWAAVLLYLVLFDFADYWRHRGEHTLRRWWALHSVHHSQRQMTFWTDDREHLLDLAIAAALRGALGVAIGVPPAQFLFVTILASAHESLSHANLRLSFGCWGDRLLVSPLYHRVHHALHFNRTSNLATLFPIWDILFRTADFSREFPPTGVDDGQEYGESFFAQQWLGLRRLLARPPSPDA